MSDFEIQNGILIKYTGSGGDVTIPDGVKKIGDRAFEWCRSLITVTIPESVTSIGYGAFYGCQNLTSVTIPDSVTSIDDRAFWECEKLTSIAIPDSVTSIGNWAFRDCKNLTSVTIPDSVTSIGDEAFDGCQNLIIIDVNEDNQHYLSLKGILFSKDKTVLIRYPAKKEDLMYVIPDGVLEIKDSAFSWSAFLKNVSIPASVQQIGDGVFAESGIEKIIQYGKNPKLSSKNIGWNCNPMVDFPEICLVTKKKLSSFAVNTTTIQNAEEYAYVWCFQSGKGWDKMLSKSTVDSNDVVSEFSELLLCESKIPVSQWNRISQFLELSAHVLDKAVIRKFLTAVSEKDKKIARKFEALPAIKAALSKDDTIEHHPIESVVEEELVITPEYISAFKEIEGGIQYADSDGICSTKVLAFIVSEYMKLHNPESVRYVSMYKTACMPYSYSGIADKVAASLNQKQLQEVLMSLAFEKGGSFILPFARFADEKHAAALVTQMKKWENWGQYAATGRKNIIIARCGLLLSDTKAAMLHMDSVGRLNLYAEMRNQDAQVIRDTVLSDSGFDHSGKWCFEMGNTEISVCLNKDLTLQIFDENTGKFLKSLPKKEVNPEIYEQIKTEISNLKKNVKKVVTNRKKEIREQFLNSQTQDAASWVKLYSENPVFRALAQLVVWQQDKKNFTLTDFGTMDAFGNVYTITEKPIGVAHPLEMEPAEVKAWQNYFAKNNLKQPFAQVWEPAYNADEITIDRYKGCEISAYKVNGKEADGIYAYGLTDYSETYGFGLKDCSLKYKQAEYCFMHGEENKLILGAFSFEHFSRYVNHIVFLFDMWTMSDRILKDDTSVVQGLSSFTAAQITELIDVAQKNNAVNVLALLLEYKNTHYADYDFMGEFVL